MPDLVVVTVFLALLVDMCLLTVVIPILPVLLQPGPYMVVHTSSVAIGVLFASKSAVQVISNIFMGAAVQKFGSRYVLAIGTITTAVSTLTFPMATSYWSLLFSRSVQGIGSGAIASAGMSLIAETYSDGEERGAAIGNAMAGLALGVLSGPILGGALFTKYGINAPFFVLVSLLAVDILGQAYLAIVAGRSGTDEENEEDDSKVGLLSDVADEDVGELSHSTRLNGEFSPDNEEAGEAGGCRSSPSREEEAPALEPRPLASPLAVPNEDFTEVNTDESTRTDELGTLGFVDDVEDNNTTISPPVLEEGNKQVVTINKNDLNTANADAKSARKERAKSRRQSGAAGTVKSEGDVGSFSWAIRQHGFRTTFAALLICNGSIAMLEPLFQLYMKREYPKSTPATRAYYWIASPAAYLLCTPLAGWISGRIAKWKIIICANFLLAISLPLIALPLATLFPSEASQNVHEDEHTPQTPLWLVEVALCLAGVAMACVDVPTQAILPVVVDSLGLEDYGVGFAITDIGACLGFCFGPMFGSLIETYWDFEGALVAYALIIVIAQPMFVGLRRYEVKTPAKEDDDSEPPNNNFCKC